MRGLYSRWSERRRPELRDFHADVLRRDILESVRLVEDDEVVWKQDAAGVLLRVRHAADEGEEERVVEHDDLRAKHALAKGLIEAAPVVAAGLRRAEVLFAADLLPDRCVRLLDEVAQRAVARGEAPLADAFELRFCSLVKRSPAWRIARSRRVAQRKFARPLRRTASNSVVSTFCTSGMSL